MSLSIIIPCYNEKSTIEILIKKLKKLKIKNVEIILIDDCSNDGTTEIIKKNLKNKLNLVLYNKKNLGKGASIIRALNYVNKKVVVIQDADLEYDPKDLEKMYNFFVKKNLDALYGSRVLGKNRYRNNTFISLHRVFFNHVLTILSNFLNKQRLSDAHTCYKMFRSDIINKLDLQEAGFCFCPELTAKLSKLNIKIKELPINYLGRSYAEGKKIKLIDGLKTIIALIRYN